jgi:hypothetical protein
MLCFINKNDSGHISETHYLTDPCNLIYFKIVLVAHWPSIKLYWPEPTQVDPRKVLHSRVGSSPCIKH